jgi:hypothetical protein
VRTNSILQITIFIIAQISFGQTTASKKFWGRYLNNRLVEGVNIINNNTQIIAVTDENGMFSIVAKEGDVLVFSSVNLDPLKRRISAEDFNSASIQSK